MTTGLIGCIRGGPPGVRVTGLSCHVNVGQELIALIADIVAGDMQLVIGQVYPFTDALSALVKMQARHARGKSVLSLT